MKCPYCGEELEQGKFQIVDRGTPKWHPDDKKYTLSDRIGGKGSVKLTSTFPFNYIKGYYCYKCKKLILDVEIEK